MRFSFERRFGSAQEQSEQSEQSELTPEQVEAIAREILANTESRNYLQAKIQQKKDFKVQTSRDDGTNVFSSWKRLGVFIVHEHKLPNQLVSILQENGVNIYGDDVLELHIPPQDTTLKDVKESFERLQEYLQENSAIRSLPKYIYGVSYLAGLAKRWGFTVVDLPEEIQKSTGAAQILESYASEITDPKKSKIVKKFDTSDIKLCYMSVEDLLSRDK